MKQIATWEANDGSLHRRRVDAAAKDREIRRREVLAKQQQACISYLFMIAAEDRYDDNGRRIPHGRLPSNTDVADGLIMHFWESRPGVPIEKAVTQAIARCRKLQQRYTMLEWGIDYEARVLVAGKASDGVGSMIDLGDIPEFKESRLSR